MQDSGNGDRITKASAISRAALPQQASPGRLATGHGERSTIAVKLERIAKLSRESGNPVAPSKQCEEAGLEIAVE
jgi:hypothetical protein